MKTIAIVYGGDSLEHDISIVTAFFVHEACQKKKWPHCLIYLSRKGSFYCGKSLEKKENYTSLHGFHAGIFVRKKNRAYFVSKGKKKEIGTVILCGHGKGVEDGTLGGYFDTLKIPVCYSGVETSAVLQNKALTKKILRSEKIPVVKSRLVTKRDLMEHHFSLSSYLHGLCAPYILKPLHLGSSIGVKKGNTQEELEKELPQLIHLEDAFLIEEAIEHLVEYNIAIVGDDRKIFLSDIEEVNHEDRVLSFHDKYEEFQGETKRIIPAMIEEEVKRKIEQYASKAFLKLGCRGVVRFDFFYQKETGDIYLNEVNSIPGSLAYYLFESKGMSFGELLEKLIDCAQYRTHYAQHQIHIYEESNLLHIARKK